MPDSLLMPPLFSTQDNLRETQPNFRHFSGFEPFARWYFGRSKLLGQHAVSQSVKSSADALA